MVSVTNDGNTIADATPQQIDIRSNLALEIGKSSFTQSPVSEDSLTETTITSSTNSNVKLGTLEYQSATTANIGDYMQLLLKDTSTTTNQIFSKYS